MDYILANNLQDYVKEHLYIKNELVSKEAFARSYSVPWLKCYRIEYLVNYYFDDVLLSLWTNIIVVVPWYIGTWMYSL